MRIDRMLPFLEEEELKLLAEKILSAENGCFNGVTIEMLLPFLDEEDVDDLFDKAETDGRMLNVFLPFVSEKKLNESVDRFVEAGRKKEILSLLPFLDEEGIRALVRAAKNVEIDLSFVELLPFMVEEDVDGLLLSAIEKKENYIELIPFASDRVLHRIVDEYISGELDVDMDQFYPFLDDEDIRKVFKHVMEKDDGHNSL